MTDWLLELIPDYGPPLLGLAVFLSCFGLPVPASILLLAAGGFASVGDLAPASVILATAAGLVAGDHTVYVLGRYGGAAVVARLGERAAPVAMARRRLAERGGVFLFLSRWLFSPIGPYVNFAAGAAKLKWRRFLAWGTAGEATWMSIYLGVGYVSAGSLAEASELAFNAIMMLGAGVVTVLLGYWLHISARRRAGRHDRREGLAGRRS